MLIRSLVLFAMAVSTRQSRNVIKTNRAITFTQSYLPSSTYAYDILGLQRNDQRSQRKILGRGNHLMHICRVPGRDGIFSTERNTGKGSVRPTPSRHASNSSNQDFPRTSHPHLNPIDGSLCQETPEQRVVFSWMAPKELN